MIRDLRKADAPRVLEFLKTQFPEEEALLGTRPEGFAKVIRRVFRWDAQLILRIARWSGRPIFRFFVVEEDGRIVATTLLSFSERSGYVSMVVVDPSYRRRGHAQALLERARVTAQSAARKYIVLDVLSQNAPARALYERIGYRPLRESSFFLREPGAATPVAPATSVRPFRNQDARALVEIARRSDPPEVQEVLPIREAHLRGSNFVNSILRSETAAWVVDRGRGPEAYLGAVSTAATDAGHCSNPIVGEGMEAADTAALVRTAIEWCSAHGSPRIVAQVPTANVRGRAALLGGGFHDALGIWTLYRPVA
jgi:ribosomal protein S18 acetylase RimI-like enzyme